MAICHPYMLLNEKCTIVACGMNICGMFPEIVLYVWLSNITKPLLSSWGSIDLLNSSFPVSSNDDGIVAGGGRRCSSDYPHVTEILRIQAVVRSACFPISV
jgi:hypothetical protein